MIRLSSLGHVVVSLFVWHPASIAGAEYSQLWGRQGELWRADSRLPDFSYAGYLARRSAGDVTAALSSTFIPCPNLIQFVRTFQGVFSSS